MTCTYQVLLRLYPADFRVSFEADMLSTFAKMADDCRAQDHSRSRFVVFVLRELIALAAGAASEWIAKWTTDRAVRGRSLPDLRMMRPPGVPKSVWFAPRRACIADDCPYQAAPRITRRSD